MYALRGGVIQKIILDLNSAPQKSWGPDDMHKLTTTFPPIMSFEIEKVPFIINLYDAICDLKIEAIIETLVYNLMCIIS